MKSFSSLPPEQEQAFVIYEQRMQANYRLGTLLGFGIAGGLFVLITMIALLGPKKKHVLPPSTVEEQKAASTEKKPAPPAETAPEEKPAETAPAETAPTDTTKPAETAPTTAPEQKPQ